MINYRSPKNKDKRAPRGKTENDDDMHLHSITQPPHLRLTYFDVPGRAEPIRWSLIEAEIEFEDERLSKEEFIALKDSGKLPFGQVPILYVDNVIFSQSSALLRYVGKLSGQYPTDFEDALRVDEILSAVIDIFAEVSTTLSEPDKEKRERYRIDLINSRLPARLHAFDQIYDMNPDETSRYIVGSFLTIADLVIGNMNFWLTSEVVEGIPKTILDEFPRLKRHMQRITSLPRIKEYRELVNARRRR